MRVRRFSPILLVMAVAACTVPEVVPTERTEALPTQLPPAELPTYAKGDRYIYDNPHEEWTIAAVRDGLVTWQSTLGETRITMFDPLLPPIRWQKGQDSGGSRQILEWSGGLFPLKAGNKLTYKDAVQVTGESGHALFVSNCYAGNPRLVQVPAGPFAAVPVYCRRSDGQKLQIYYAPALNNAVSLVLIAPDGREMTRNLLAFMPGNGPRVVAPRIESLPGGWSAAAIANWSQDTAGLPRVRPERVASANPPVGLASPSDRSRSADELQPAEEEARLRTQRTMLALHAPKPTPAPAPAPMVAAPPAPVTQYGAHVGSFKSREAAERAWPILGRQSAVIKGAARHAVYSIDLGGSKGMMYRLVAGPSPTKAEAVKVCEAIKADGAYCRVVAYES
jgi:hypothetical protein